jgi:hypothetical protein
MLEITRTMNIKRNSEIGAKNVTIMPSPLCAGEPCRVFDFTHLRYKAFAGT